MQIAMIGSGYVGLVSGACMAEFGHTVVCVDKDGDRVDMLRQGRIPIYEPGLEGLVHNNVANNRLAFETDLASAVAAADAVFIAVGTPGRRGSRKADLTYVFTAAEEIAAHLTGYTVVVTKSTVPVGTGRQVAGIIHERAPEAEFDIASNPEFLREGSAIEDFMRPDRVVVGTESERAQEVMRDVYRPLFINETPMLFTTLETSELIKYAGNSFLAAKITFINEIADLCEKVGADVQVVARGIGLDGRIGSKFLHAGPGYGGSCFPKDTRALAETASEHGVDLTIVDAVVSANERRKQGMADKVVAACGGSVAGQTIAVLGVAFKPNTDDMRESPSLDILPRLKELGATIRAYDPAAMDEAIRVLDGIDWCDSAFAAIEGSDALVIITEWNEFRALDLDRVKAVMRRPLMIDLRNIYDATRMASAGFDYHSVGRPHVRPGS